MKKLYSYNTGSKALHINGFCHNCYGSEYKYFDSESEAISFSGGQIFLCKDCERERDKILREAIQAKKENNR
ncbi:MAG: hypothetical protein SOZ28_03450 [Clostridia bacterium]|nr:hypothetical protein [Clostridia bacterium]